MEKRSDSKLITLYQSRSEIAISETKNKYGRLIYSVAYELLRNTSDAEECENDTYLGLWKAIPPAKPKNFKAFCLKITRNLAIKNWIIIVQKREIVPKRFHMKKYYRKQGR